MALPDLPSRVDPAPLVRRALGLLAALAVGFLLQDLLRSRIDAIATLSERDMLRARAELATLFRIVGTGVFSATGGLGAALAESARRSSGNRVRLLCALGGLLIAASLAGTALTWYAAAVLDACRA